MATLVSGNPGAGKSTLAALLRSRGVRALDADEVPGLAAWMNSRGDVVGDGSLEPTAELLATCFWGWTGPRVEQVIEELGEDGVLLGVAVNQWDFIDMFDGLVLLELDASTQRDRVASRDPLFREQIAAGLPVMQAQMLARGAQAIDATQDPVKIAQELCALLRIARGSGSPT
jgi:dephospho-CoA kinase